MKKYILLFLVVPLLNSCKSMPLGSWGGHIKNQKIYYKDRYIPFNPKRYWSISVGWDFDFASQEHALLKYGLGFYAKSTDEKARLKEFVNKLQTPEAVVSWYASRVFPYFKDFKQNRFDIKLESQGESYVFFEFLKTKPVIKENKYLTGQGFYVVDSLLEGLLQSCDLRTNKIRQKGDSLGIEMILQSKDSTPEALRWDYDKKQISGVTIQKWSYAQEHSMVYRMIFEVASESSLCPVPRTLRDEILNAFTDFNDRTGIEW